MLIIVRPVLVFCWIQLWYYISKW